MHPAEWRVLPEIPAAISARLIKTPCGKEVIIDIHKLRQDRPPYDLQHRIYYDDNRRI